MMFDPNLLKDAKQEEDPDVIKRLEKHAWMLVVVFVIVMVIGVGLMVSLR